jgi:hypothetical protein
MFHGPGIEEFDATVQKMTRLSEGSSLQMRVEAFNLFNHAQFYGPSAVDGQIEDPSFGRVVAAASPRLIQIAAKVAF